MRRNGCAILVALAVVLLAWPASAQDERQPKAGAFAIGGDLGFFVPGGTSGTGPTVNPLSPTGSLDVGASFGALFEFYLLPRLSIRGMAGTAGTGFTDTTQTLRRGWVVGSLVYNWEAELWHPFIAGGVGAYFPQVGSKWESRAGGHIGGGIEYFARPNVTIKLEALYHFVEHGGVGSTNPTGATFTAGLKKYF